MFFIKILVNSLIYNILAFISIGINYLYSFRRDDLFRLRRPTIFPLPEFVLKLLFGQGAIVLTASKEINPKALLENGFVFKYQDIESSLKHLVE